jgi:hypothetical protein
MARGAHIDPHGEPDRDDYWTNLEREQFESNAKHGDVWETKWLAGLAGLSFSEKAWPSFGRMASFPLVVVGGLCIG